MSAAHRISRGKRRVDPHRFPVFYRNYSITKLLVDYTIYTEIKTLPVVLTIGVQKIVNYFSQRNFKSNAEVESAKQELIQGIKDYDATQSAHAGDNDLVDTPESDKHC